MKTLKLSNLGEGQSAFKLDGGERIIVEVKEERPVAGLIRLQMRAWQIEESGQRLVDADDQSAVILPTKYREVTDGPRVEDEIADAVVTLVERMEKHITARKVAKAIRASNDPARDRDRDVL